MPAGDKLPNRDIKRGVKRLVFAACILIVGGLLLYHLADNYIFERRKHLLTVEILADILLANFLSIGFFFLSNRTYQWILRGFRGENSSID